MLLTHLSQRWDHSRIAPGKSPVCFVPSMTWTCSHQVYIFSLANVESCVLGWPFAPTRPELNSTTVHPAVSTRKVGSSRKQYWPWPLDSAQQHYVRDRKSGCMNLLIREAIELHPNHTNFLQWRKQKTFSKNWALLNLNPLAPNCIYIYIYIYIYICASSSVLEGPREKSCTFNVAFLSHFSPPVSLRRAVYLSRKSAPFSFFIAPIGHISCHLPV